MGGFVTIAAVTRAVLLALALATGAGVVQAPGMTRLCQRAVREPRGLIGALTVALLALGAALAS